MKRTIVLSMVFLMILALGSGALAKGYNLPCDPEKEVCPLDIPVVVENLPWCEMGFYQVLPGGKIDHAVASQSLSLRTHRNDVNDVDGPARFWIAANFKFDLNVQSDGAGLGDIAQYVRYQVRMEPPAPFNMVNKFFDAGESTNLLTDQSNGRYYGWLNAAIDFGTANWFDVEAGEFEDTITLTLAMAN